MVVVPTANRNGTLTVIASLCACRFVASVALPIRSVASDWMTSERNRVIVFLLGDAKAPSFARQPMNHISISAASGGECDIDWLSKVKLRKDASRRHSDRLVSGRRRAEEENGPGPPRRR